MASKRKTLKNLKAKSLIKSRAKNVKGGYTMFLPDGTPLRAASTKAQGRLEYPNISFIDGSQVYGSAD